MFRTNEIKDSRRGKDKQEVPDESDLFNERPDERTLPYFSIVPEQVQDDERYSSLDSTERAYYWLLVIHALWKEGGRCTRHPGLIAKRLRIDVKEWELLERSLLDCKLLTLSPDGFHLVQPELRTQYLMTLETNNNKRRKKKEVKSPTSVHATESASESTA